MLLSRIWSQVERAGCHFRSLEHLLWRLIESQDGVLSKCPSRAENWFDNPPFVPIQVHSYPAHVRAQAVQVFRRLIIDATVWDDEETMSEALRTGMVYVGERDGANLSRIRPFLHLNQFYGDLRSWRVFSPNDVVPRSLREPLGPDAALSAVLVFIADLFHAHEVARQPALSEFVMLAVVASRILELRTRAGGRQGVSIVDVLPGALVNIDGWPATGAGEYLDKLCFDVDLHDAVTIMRSLLPSSRGRGGRSDTLTHTLTQPSGRSTLFTVQGAVTTEAMVAVGPTVTAGGEARRSLWALKLQERMSCSDIVAKTKLSLPGSTDRDILIVVAPRVVGGDHIVPRNTIVVPFETVVRMLRPFGASVLLTTSHAVATDTAPER